MNKREKKLFNEKLAEYGVEANELNKEESKQLRDEVRAELRGDIVMDSVLFRTPNYSLKRP